MTLEEYIKKERLTVTDTARKLNLSTTTLYAVMRGEVVGETTKRKLACVGIGLSTCDVDPDELRTMYEEYISRNHVPQSLIAKELGFQGQILRRFRRGVTNMSAEKRKKLEKFLQENPKLKGMHRVHKKMLAPQLVEKEAIEFIHYIVRNKTAHVLYIKNYKVLKQVVKWCHDRGREFKAYQKGDEYILKLEE